MRYLSTLIFSLAIFCLAAQSPSAEQILRNIDRNMTSSSSRSTTRMVISSRRSTRTVSSTNYSRNNTEFFTEYTAPPRERGTKMLKVGNNLWIYDPNTQRTVQISGNMLRQSVMGSDLSYEDFMEGSNLVSQYNASLEDDLVYEGRACWNLLLTAKSNSVAYHSKRIYVDKERYVPLFEQWYARSGRLLKTIKAYNVSRIGNRWYPRRILFKDELRQGSGTEYIIDDIEFDVRIPDSVFSRSRLSN